MAPAATLFSAIARSKKRRPGQISGRPACRAWLTQSRAGDTGEDQAHIDLRTVISLSCTPPDNCDPCVLVGIAPDDHRHADQT
jgi:hypothetical protein